MTTTSAAAVAKIRGGLLVSYVSVPFLFRRHGLTPLWQSGLLITTVCCPSRVEAGEIVVLRKLLTSTATSLNCNQAVLFPSGGRGLPSARCGAVLFA